MKDCIGPLSVEEGGMAEGSRKKEVGQEEERGEGTIGRKRRKEERSRRDP